MYLGNLPLEMKVQGYIYYGKIICERGYSTYPDLKVITAMNLDGKLCFWFPRLGYWQGFSVKLTTGYGGPENGINRVIAVEDSTDPQGTKRVEIYIDTLATQEWANSKPSNNITAENINNWNDTFDNQSNNVTLSDIQNITGQKKFSNSIPLAFKSADKKSWAIHKPLNDSLIIAPSQSTNGEDWDWANQINFGDNGSITSNGYVKNNSNDDWLLTGGGGHTHKNQFPLNNHTHRFLKSDDTGIIDANSLFEDYKFKFNNRVESASSNMFPTINNANSIISIATHPGGYGTLLGINGDSDIFTKNVSGGYHSPTWKQLAYRDWVANNYIPQTHPIFYYGQPQIDAWTNDKINGLPISYFGTANDANNITKSGFYNIAYGTLNTGNYSGSNDGARALLHFETESIYSASQIQTERYTGNILSRTRNDGGWTAWIRHWGNNDFTQQDVNNWKALQLASGDYVTKSTNQIITGLKAFVTGGGNYAPFNNALQIYADDGSLPSMTWSKGGSHVGQLMFNSDGFHFKNGDNNNYYRIKSDGFKKNGFETDDWILLGSGNALNKNEFATSSQLDNYVTIDTAQTIVGNKTFSPITETRFFNTVDTQKGLTKIVGNGHGYLNTRTNPTEYSFWGNPTGAIVIILPDELTFQDNFDIDIIDVQWANLHQKLQINTYGSLSYSKALLTNDTGAVDVVKRIRIGKLADNRSCLIINDIDTLWSYPHMTVNKYIGGGLLMATGNWTTQMLTDLSSINIQQEVIIKKAINNSSLTAQLENYLPLTGGTLSDYLTIARPNGSTFGGIHHLALTADNLDATGFSMFIPSSNAIEMLIGNAGGWGTIKMQPYGGNVTINGNNVATQTWVSSQGYLTSSNLNGYATESWVSVNYANQTLSTGAEGLGGQTLTLSNGNAVTITNNFITSPDGTRNPDDVKPNTSGNRVRFDFANASSVKGAGNYAGVMTYAPWDGTTASTGDSSYQMAFANQTGINGEGIPMLKLRKGIDDKWSSDWYKMWSAGDFSQNDIDNWNYLASNAATQTWTSTNFFSKNGGTVDGKVKITPGVGVTGNSPTIGSSDAASFALSGDNGLWGTAFGHNSNTGDLWIQPQRFDGGNALYNINLAPLGGNVTVNNQTVATQNWVESQDYANHSFVEESLNQLTAEHINPDYPILAESKFTTVIITEEYHQEYLDFDSNLIPGSQITVINLASFNIDVRREDHSIDRIFSRETTEYYITKEKQLLKKGSYKEASILS